MVTEPAFSAILNLYNYMVNERAVSGIAPQLTWEETMENQDKDFAAPADPAAEQLAVRIQNNQKHIKDAEDQSAELAYNLKTAVREVEEAECRLAQLRQEQSAAIENLAQAQKEEAELQIKSSGEARLLSASQQREREIAEERLAALTVALEQARAQADQKAQQCEVALAAFTVQQNLAQQMADELNAQHQLLQDELDRINQQLNETVKAASAKHSIAHIEKEATEVSLVMAEKALAEVAAALAEADVDLERRQDELEQLYRTRQVEEEAIRQRNSEAVAAVRQAEEALAAIHKAKLDEVEKARSLAEISAGALTAGEETLLGLIQELQALYASTQEEARALSDRMETVLKHAFSERQAYTKILAVATNIKEQARQAEEYESQLTERVNILRRESQNLRNAALVAKNLAADATIAKANASKDMFSQVDEMERALIAAADEAEHLSVRKQTDLLEVENALAAVLGTAAKKRQAANEAQKLLTEAAQNCLAAEQEMLDLTTNVEANSGDHHFASKQIKEKQALYERTVQEVAALREAAAVAGNHLRLMRAEAEQVERDYINAARDTARVVASCEKEALEAEESITARITQSQAMLMIVREKRDKLAQSQAEKQLTVDQCYDLLKLKNELSAAAAEEYHHTKVTAENNFSTLKARIDATIAKDQEGVAVAWSTAEAASREYEQALNRSVQAADRIAGTRSELEESDIQQEELLARQEEQRATARLQAEEAAAEKAAQVRRWQETLRALENPINIAQLDLQVKRKAVCCLHAGREALASRLSRIGQDVAADEQQYQALRAAEAQRRAEEAEALRIAQAKERDRRLREEEAARLAAEQEQRRVAQELEAAHMMAEAEMAALAAEKARREEAAEAEVVRLAAGQVLTKEDNVALITSGQLKARMKRLEELSREEAQALAQRHISKAEADELAATAKIATAEAKEHLRLFRSAQTTLNSLTIRLQEKQAQRKLLGREWARCIAALDHASFEQDALKKACHETERAGLTTAGTSYKLLNRAMRQLHQALEDNQIIISSCRADLQALQDKVTCLDAELRRISRGRAQAEDFLAELAGKWIYKERSAIKASARAEALHLHAEGGPQIQEQVQ